MSALHVLNLLPEATSLLGGAPSARSTLVRHAREIFVASSAALLVPASPAVRPGHLRLPFQWGRGRRVFVGCAENQPIPSPFQFLRYIRYRDLANFLSACK